MLTGGYGNNRFFSKNTRDLFISPQADGPANYGIGWWREADNRRVWYFGTQSPENTVGHQGWTGTLTMIDFENRMAVVYLTNRINTPLADPSSLEMANTFCGDYYTSVTLGFVPQILYMGMNGQNADLDKALDRLAADMAKEKQKLVEKQAAADGRPLDEDHPLMKAYAAIREAADKRK
jgi:CubicO group peptidase (beta-lactamase class C family)